MVTPPDRPQGRGRRLGSPPVAETARELGLELLQVASVNDPAALARIGAEQAEAPVLCAFGQMIGAELLAGPPILNVHPSLLPRWRGAAPIERAIMAGDDETGVTVMRLAAELDAGPVALREAVPIRDDDDFGSLSDRLAELGGELIVRALDLAAAGALEFEQQDGAAATYAEKIGAVDRRLDPRRPAAELARQVRALTPHIGAYLELEDGERLGVRRVRAESRDGAVDRPGAMSEDEGALWLACGEGGLRIERLQPPGGREMDAAELLRGRPLPRLAAMRED
ncbi:MAG: methionyl-tRNA formyltransferase [Solirubrobacterales bacterium]|nr:methionyl-tRNA formyltransferase [Solirubrobacterales bacterium]